MPFILIGLGGIILLALLSIPVRIILRRRLVPIPSPKVPPSGAAPWSRTSASDQLVQPNANYSNNMFNTPYSASFATATTQAQSSQPFPMPSVVPTTNGYIGLTQNSQAFSTPPVIPTWNNGNSPNSAPAPRPDIWLFEGTQSQQPIPTTPPLIPQVEAEYEINEQEQSNGLIPPTNPFAEVSRSIDSSNTAARKRLRRNGLRPADAQPAFPEQILAGSSSDMLILSDPYLRAMLQRYSQKGQAVKQTPEESS